MTLQAIGREWEDVEIASASVIRVFKGPIYIGLEGTTDDNAGFKIGTEFLADAGSTYAFRGPGYIDVLPYAEIGLPSAFVAGNWSLTAGDGQVTITISALPSLNGGTISRIDYRVNNGPWVDIGRTTTGSEVISPLENDEPVTIRLRVVTNAGSGPASDAKTATPSE